MKYKRLAVAISALTANAYALDGKVISGSGNPIPDAVIEIVGSREAVSVNDQGRFSFNEADAHEIHVTAPGFSHKVIHLDEVDKNEPLIISLNRSVIEQIDVIGIPIHASVIESAQPISVLSGEALRNSQAATLGDSLEKEVGVHTNFHGNVTSTPIIRGLSGPRVQITQNSLDVSDVSRVGPDHAVASEASTAEQVEVLRGPATLFFGSGAIGGVVNVVDKRVPKDSDTYGEWYLSHESVNSQNMGSVNLNSGKDNFAFHFDGFWRESEDYEVPEEPELHHDEDDHEHEESNFTVANSSDESHGFTLGSSYLLENGYVGVSYGKLDRIYGIPGHSHGGDEPETDEANVYADLEQDRIQIISELDVDNRWLSAINTRFGYTDYTHAEVEEGFVGTLFSNETLEAKLDLLHQPFSEWKGGLVFHYKNSDASAEGAEAFTPPSESQSIALAMLEERHMGDFLLQLGARVEQVNITAENVLMPQLEVHSHGEEEEADEHDHEGEASVTRVFKSDQEFLPVSFSAGVVWDFKPGYNLALSISHAERAPSASELLSFGAHIGERIYSIGALFDIHQEGEEAHFELNEEPLDLETSNNIDLTFRKHEGDLGLILNAFFNQVDNYYYQMNTGFYAANSHSHEHEHEEGEEEDIHADELPVYIFTSADAELYGFEAQGIWQVTPRIKTTVFTDYVHAELKNSGAYLPRTPPLRLGARLDYKWNKISANLSWSHYADQNKAAALESTTEGYDWVDAIVTWHFPVASSELALFFKAENLTDEQARVHTSFLKDIAPKPGRNFSIGLRGTF